MEKLSSLVRELRERIAASTSSNGGTEDNEPLEIRFRSVLPNLPHAYVLPSANEREVIAVLKLLSHTARNFPGVFYHGKANAVLPVIGRILPFFAEPAFMPKDGPGILIDITDKPRWQLFATWTIKIMSKCLTEGTLYVEGLINASFVSSACALLCYGDATLHMSGGPGDWRVSITLLCVLKLEVCNIECLAGVAGRIDDRSERFGSMLRKMQFVILPWVLALLHRDSSCSDDVVELTTTDLIGVFSQSLPK
ncbi:hypothetical protein IFM89_020376 [Coptis chinensis]|uniref:Uncharacterized protein n=1 Tax=Coptis chinensis TaxID=261450 RepID=A0A835HNZ9_9MAGN|nr:hypothetical protein IFM89_020376 [Coptis chinensis]